LDDLTHRAATRAAKEDTLWRSRSRLHQSQKQASFGSPEKTLFVIMSSSLSRCGWKKKLQSYWDERSRCEGETVDSTPGYRNGVRHEVQRWNGWKIPSPIQVSGESLGRSIRWMQAGGERAAPERYWCGAMQTAKRPGLTKR